MEKAKTVFVCDDDDAICELVAVWLTEVGFTVRTGYGDAALAAIQANPPDMVLLDMQMPGDQGVYATVGENMLNTIRHDLGLRATPVVAMTASPGTADAAVRMGAQPTVLIKPFWINDVLRAVTAAIGLPPATNEVAHAPPDVATAQDAVTRAVADAQIAVRDAVAVAVETAAVAEAAVADVKVAVDAEQHAQEAQQEAKE